MCIAAPPLPSSICTHGCDGWCLCLCAVLICRKGSEAHCRDGMRCELLDLAHLMQQHVHDFSNHWSCGPGSNGRQSINAGAGYESGMNAGPHVKTS
jgi:hypothetical protein